VVKLHLVGEGIALETKANEQTTTPQSLGGIQSQGGVSRLEGR